MYGVVPEGFELVDLGDPSTWHMATLREWIDLRSELLELQDQARVTPEMWRDFAKARQKAIRQLWREEGISRKKNKPPIKGRLKQRLDEILKRMFFDKHEIPEGLMQWEMDFLRASEWVDVMDSAYYKSIGQPTPKDTSGLVRILVDRILLVEDEFGVAEKRQETRDLHADSVSPRSDRHLKTRRNPYLPRPLELIGIYRAVLIMIERIAASPLRPAQVKSKHTRNGEAGNFDRFRTTVIRPHVIKLIHGLQRLGYETYLDVDDGIMWKDWNAVGHVSRAKLARQFIAELFRSKESTIKRDTSRSSLRVDYDKYGIADEHRDFLDGGRTLSPATIYETGWYTRLEDGHPADLARRELYLPPTT